LALTGYTSRAVTEQGIHVERDGGEITLTIEVPREVIQKKEQELLAAVQGELKVPGFRRGKTPAHLALRYYGEDEFVQDLKDDLVREWLSRALRELDLHPVTSPTVEMTAFARGERLAFQVTFAVLPELVIPDEIAVDVPVPAPIKITDEEVAGVLAGLRREAAALEPKERPAEEGDMVRFRRGNRNWEGEATSSRPVGAQLLGAKTGDRITLVDEGGRSEAFAVAGVYQVLLPTHEEAAGYYGHPSWGAFDDAVRQKLTWAAEGRRRREWRSSALDALAESLQVKVPATLLAEAIAEETKELRIHPDQKPQLEALVQQRLRREIVAQRLAEAKGLHPDEDEVKRLAEEQGRDEGAVRAGIVLERAADWIIAQTRRDA
jgi:FKBP-type peptidyl-prolyl cis-trans isomerase (trigger factor)